MLPARPMMRGYLLVPMAITAYDAAHAYSTSLPRIVRRPRRGPRHRPIAAAPATARHSAGWRQALGREIEGAAGCEQNSVGLRRLGERIGQRPQSEPGACGVQHRQLRRHDAGEPGAHRIGLRVLLRRDRWHHAGTDGGNAGDRRDEADIGTEQREAAFPSPLRRSSARTAGRNSPRHQRDGGAIPRPYRRHRPRRARSRYGRAGGSARHLRLRLPNRAAYRWPHCGRGGSAHGAREQTPATGGNVRPQRIIGQHAHAVAAFDQPANSAHGRRDVAAALPGGKQEVAWSLRILLQQFVQHSGDQDFHLRGAVPEVAPQQFPDINIGDGDKLSGACARARPDQPCQRRREGLRPSRGATCGRYSAARSAPDGAPPAPGCG